LRYSINLNEIIKNYKYDIESNKKFKIIHSSTQKIKLFPFTTRYEEKFKGDKSKQFENFIGDFARKAINKDIDKNINKSEILENIINNISNLQEEKKSYIKSFFEELFFEEENLVFSHPKLIFRLPKSNVEEIAYFMVDVFLSETNKEFLEIYEDSNDSDDILIQLLLNSLSKLKESKYSQNYYSNFISLKRIFNDDLNFVMKNKTMFVENFDNFLKFYYFIYISQLSLKLNKFFNVDLKSTEEVYFNLNIEKASKTRISYQNGWKMLECSNLFSHTHTLEMLNTSNNDNSYLYSELKYEFEKLNKSEQKELLKEINEIINWYMNKAVCDVDWNVFNENNNFNQSSFESVVLQLFKVIDYQFNNAKSREKNYKSYSKWFTEFAKEYFLKIRGPLGYTLNLTEDYIFLLTKLAMKNLEKIRLNDLFTEFQKRGVFLDKDSKKSLKDLFDDLNLLDKKSDSGDAIYVKSII